MLPVDVLWVTDPLAWALVALFGGGTLAERRSPATARYAVASAWALFAVFWLLLVPHFFLVRNSFVEAGTPTSASLASTKLFWTRKKCGTRSSQKTANSAHALATA